MHESNIIFGTDCLYFLCDGKHRPIEKNMQNFVVVYVYFAGEGVPSFHYILNEDVLLMRQTAM